MKKATPKAVFDACEQLELQDRAWNRDDVRSLVGGGSFSVIDPLIQAWRKLQPVREVAPSVPADLLIQVATMLEQQVSGYVEQVEQRDQERESTLLEMNSLVSANLQDMEFELTDKLELSQQANHALEAELSRLETELNEKSQQNLGLELNLQVSKDAEISLNERLKEKQEHYEGVLGELKSLAQQREARLLEQHHQQITELKLESQQQLLQQKSELTDAAEVSENRLMRLLDQGRNELKEQQISLNNRNDSLQKESQIKDQLVSRKTLEIKSLESLILQMQQDEKQRDAQNDALLSSLKDEKLNLQQQIQESNKEKGDLGSLRDSIQLLREQLVINN
jgi:chromosome segregation ATPase